MLRRLFRTSERELVEALRRHVSLSREALRISISMLGDHGALGERGVLELRARVVELEKEGDRIYDALVSSVLRGALPLPLTAELGALLDDVDDVLDLIYFLGTELSRGMRAGLARKPAVEEIYALTRGMAERAAESLEALDSLLSHVLGDLRRAVEEASRIDYIEDVVDDMKGAAIERVYAMSGELSVLEFSHLLEVIRTIDTIVDKVQDIAQELVRVFSAVLS